VIWGLGGALDTQESPGFQHSSIKQNSAVCLRVENRIVPNVITLVGTTVCYSATKVNCDDT
jgi:hypothetical protein